MDDDVEMMRLARMAVFDAAEPGRIAEAAPGSFGCHEALDRAAVIMDLLGDSLLEHPSIVGNAEWFRLADEAHTKLLDLYQAIGAKHLLKED